MIEQVWGVFKLDQDYHWPPQNTLLCFEHSCPLFSDTFWSSYESPFWWVSLAQSWLLLSPESIQNICLPWSLWVLETAGNHRCETWGMQWMRARGDVLLNWPTWVTAVFTAYLIVPHKDALGRGLPELCQKVLRCTGLKGIHVVLGTQFCLVPTVSLSASQLCHGHLFCV